MTTGDHEKLRRLFEEAAATAPVEREAFLAAACGGDIDLRRRLGAMLAAAEDEVFLGSPTVGEGPNPSSSAGTTVLLREGPGTRIGPYTIVRQIGEGGFGAVFLAEQAEPVRRTVALKIVKLGMDTREVVARFEQERQALALMDHPNIARVIDAGATAAGRPYFVMDYVEGRPIMEYCDKENLSVEERLELFGQVCHAVQHAHSKGIIHRDLKPSNLLVAESSGRPAVKIIDFGIAKAISTKLTDKTFFTEVRQIIGTVQYMSPEQAEGSVDIDTRTDVYALGVVLYELLTGSTPFDARTLRDAMYGEIQRMIREVDPPKPSTRLVQSHDTIASIAACRRVEPKRLGAIVRGELDWIVMRALEKDRGRRYATAEGLADDVRRHLLGEAVVAAPPGAAYRFRKFLRRNRAAATAGVAVAASLLAGIVAFAWQAKVARRERDRAIAAESLIAKRADELRLVSDFQAKMLEKIDPTEAGITLVRDLRAKHAKALAERGIPEDERASRLQAFDEELARVNATDAALELVDGTILAPAVDAIDAQFSDQPLVEATLRNTLANLYVKIGRYDRALPLQESALATRKDLLGEEDADTLRCVQDMGVLLQLKGEYARAEPLFREALEAHRRVRGPDHAAAIVSLSSLGGNLRYQGRLEDAEPILREAVARSKRALGPDDRNTMICENVLGFLLVDQGKLAEAEPLWRETYQRGRKALGPDDPDTLVWANNLGGLLDSVGHLAEGEVFYREAYESTRRVRGEEHPSTLTCARNLAVNLEKQGRYAEAEPIARENVEASRRTLGGDHPDTLAAMQTLGALLKRLGRPSEAETYLRTAYETRLRTLGEDHPSTLGSAAVLAPTLVDLGKTDEAESLLRRVLDAPRDVWSDDHPERLIVMNNLGNLLSQEGKVDEAEPLLRGAYESRIRISGPEHPETLVLQSNVARVLEELGRLAEAEAMYRDATEKFRRVLGDDHPNTAASQMNVGGALLAQKRFSDAEPFWREGERAALKSLGPDHARTGAAHLGLGRALAGRSRFAEAETSLLEAHRVLSTAQGVKPAKLEAVRKALADLYEAWDQAEPGQGHGAAAERWR